LNHFCEPVLRRTALDFMEQELQVEYNGNVYRGFRSLDMIENGNVMQTIHYRERAELDSKAYPPNDSQRMNSMAKMILMQLVRQAQSEVSR
jgi:hypothetical protein